MGSCVDDVPTVVSVPKNIKCLSGVETKLNADAVGAPDIIVALVLFAPVGFESHSKLSPPFIVAISLLPKLSSDQSPGAVTISPDAAAFHEKKFDASVTVAPLECIAAVVPTAPLVNPDNVPPLFPVYVISSVPICTVPDDGKELELAIVKDVTDAFIPDDSVEVNCPCCTPPHDPRPQPVVAVSTAGPTG
jgi:hypothetical protein